MLWGILKTFGDRNLPADRSLWLEAPQLLMCISVPLAGTDAFLLESIFRNEVWEHMQLPVSEDNERGCYQQLIDGCTAALAGYPTSIDEDLALVARWVLKGWWAG